MWSKMIDWLWEELIDWEWRNLKDKNAPGVTWRGRIITPDALGRGRTGHGLVLFHRLPLQRLQQVATVVRSRRDVPEDSVV